MVYSIIRVLVFAVLLSQSELVAQEASVLSTERRRAVRKFERQKAELDKNFLKDFEKLKSAYVSNLNANKKVLVATLDKLMEAEAQAVNLAEANKIAALIEKLQSTDPVPPNEQANPKSLPNSKIGAATKTVTLTRPYPNRNAGTTDKKISIQYAVIEIARQAELKYDFEASKANTAPVCRQYIQPEIENQPYDLALTNILAPFGLSFTEKSGTIVLIRREQ